MFHIEPKYLPKPIEAIILLVIIIGLISFFIIGFATPPHIPILLAIFLLIGYGLIKKMNFPQLEEGIIQGAKSGIGAVFLFVLIGVLISSWIISGTIPVLIDTGFSFISGHWFYAIVFTLTAIIGTSLGSSFTTSATIGVAFIGMAQAMDASLAITAGAIVSGAFFGDKMSPLSDTTNLASTIVKVDLFTHIKNMAWTTVPAFVISLILYAILSPEQTINNAQFTDYQNGIIELGFIDWSSWIPLIVLIVLTFFKTPAFITIAVSSLIASTIAGINGNVPWMDIWGTWFNGFTAETGFQAVDSLLSRGGINSMLFTISLVILALGLGGLLFVTGVIPAILYAIQEKLVKVRTITITTALTAVGVNVLIGEQYLSILLTGEAYQGVYEKAGLARKNLSRTLEDAGTVINPLVPWSVCGVFLADVLSVPVLTYLPFAFFCLLSPILTILIRGNRKT